MLKQRVIAALCMVPIVLCCLFLLPITIFSLLMIVLCVVAAWEWGQFAGFLTNKARWVMAGIIGIILLLLWLPYALQGALSSPSFHDSLFIKIVMWVGLVWWCVAFFMVVFYPRSAGWWRKSAILSFIFALVTLIPFFFSMIVLRQLMYDHRYFIGGWYLLYVMFLVWSADTGAYTFGRLFGKHKLAPAVSPGKTIEGLIGGLVCAAIIGSLLNWISPLPFSFFPLLSSAIIATLASILGDLTESMFKREAGIKDSSALIPGHGGILDRIDSLTAAIPVFVCLIFYVF